MSKVTTALFLLLSLILATVFAEAQDGITERAKEVATHLLDREFEEIQPGLSALRTRAPNNVELILVRINQQHFQFLPVIQENEKGDRVEIFAKNHDALIAINGGFFKEDAGDRKTPVGKFQLNGKSHSLAWKSAGGYFVMNKDRARIIPTLGSPIPKAQNFIQSKPTLIEPGSKWAMNKHLPFTKKRTIICEEKGGNILLMLIVGRGLSLFEAGWLLREKSVGGVYGCDSALAMDGGGSTQIWFKDREDLSFAGETGVHNAIIIKGR